MEHISHLTKVIFCFTPLNSSIIIGPFFYFFLFLLFYILELIFVCFLQVKLTGSGYQMLGSRTLSTSGSRATNWSWLKLKGPTPSRPPMIHLTSMWASLILCSSQQIRPLRTITLQSQPVLPARSSQALPSFTTATRPVKFPAQFPQDPQPKPVGLLARLSPLGTSLIQSNTIQYFLYQK